MDDTPSEPESSTSAHLRSLVDRLRAGDDGALGALFERLEGRLRALARRMLRGYPAVRRWEETDDVLQNALVRLHRSLASAPVVDSTHFFRLAALQIRRELLTLARLHRDRVKADIPGAEGRDAPILQLPESTWEPSDLALWTEFHERAERLPEPSREVFDLVFYHGLTQVEVAEMLGVTDRTVRTRWRDARLTLAESLGGRLPGL